MGKKEKVSRVLLVFSSILIALVLAEILLRLVGFRFAFFPSKVQFGWPDPFTLESWYKVDKELLWVRKDYNTKLETWRGKKPSIVFMGDSCTEFGTYDKSLKTMIDAKYPGNNFSYVNVGVGGWSSYQGLQQLKRDVVAMKPRVVTIYYGWNDHWCSFGIEDKDIGKFNLEHQISAVWLSRLRSMQVFNRVIFKLKKLGSIKNERRPERVALADFVSNLYHMVKIARENNITPILITAPSSHKIGNEPTSFAQWNLNNLEELVPLHQKYVQAVRKVADDIDVLLIDLALEFSKFSEVDLAKFFSKDGVHFTEEGSKKVAESMYEYFVSSGVIDSIAKEN